MQLLNRICGMGPFSVLPALSEKVSLTKNLPLVPPLEDGALWKERAGQEPK